jgi:hypothetical protein
VVGGGVAFGIYKYYHSPSYLEGKSQEHTHDIYRRAKEVFGDNLSKDEFAKKVHEYLPVLPIPIEQKLFDIALDFYDTESFGVLPPPPLVCNSIEGARYRDLKMGLLLFLCLRWCRIKGI